MEKLLTVAFVFYMIGAAVQMVGRLPECSTGPYQWWLPLLVAAVMGVPAFLAYLAGIKDGKELQQ